VRYGAAANLYGYEAISAFRAGRSPARLVRTLQHGVLATFGRNFATASTEFRRAGNPRRGRQTQSRVRFPEGWRVVAAHVSPISREPLPPDTHLTSDE